MGPAGSDDQLDRMFSALGDRTRRAVIRILSDNPGVTATQLAGQFSMTRQAMAKHLETLSQAGLVTSARSGRETHWGLVPAGLRPAVDWLTEAESTFPGRMSDLQRHLEVRRSERQLPGSPPRIAAERTDRASGQPRRDVRGS